MPASKKKYELMLAFMPTLTEKEVEKELVAVKNLIGKKGEVVYEQIWGKRDLYYKIKKFDKAIYVLLHFLFADPTDSLRKEFSLMGHVLRFLLLTLPRNYQIRPFVPLEDVEKKVGTEEKKEKVKKVGKVPEPVVKEKKKPETLPETPVKKEEAPKKKKSTFDEKIDEIIENLDNL